MDSLATTESKKNSFEGKYSSYVMGMDVGGTNINVGVAGIKNNRVHILFSLKFKTKDLESILKPISQVLDYSKKEHGIDLATCCIAAAGVVSPKKDYVKLTNADLEISVEEIMKKTNLKKVFIINDFQAIGYGINLIDHSDPNDIYIVRGTGEISFATKAVIGAGTGLGKCILMYDPKTKTYLPLPSEGGHADLPIKDYSEMDLLNFIKEKIGIKKQICYEEVLSGRGLENIYYYLREKRFGPTKYSIEIDKSEDKAEAISKYKNLDENCRETFRIFTRFFARCAKNFVLDTMALGGLYIAGGIAMKNKEIFKTKEFFEEFEAANRREDVLARVPIYIINNPHISLYGTCLAAMLENKI